MLCNKNGFGSHDCSHHEDVSIICQCKFTTMPKEGWACVIAHNRSSQKYSVHNINLSWSEHVLDINLATVSQIVLTRSHAQPPEYVLTVCIVSNFSGVATERSSTLVTWMGKNRLCWVHSVHPEIHTLFIATEILPSTSLVIVWGFVFTCTVLKLSVRSLLSAVSFCLTFQFQLNVTFFQVLLMVMYHLFKLKLILWFGFSVLMDIFYSAMIIFLVILMVNGVIKYRNVSVSLGSCTFSN